jgi:hypothetical protein
VWVIAVAQSKIDKRDKREKRDKVWANLPNDFEPLDCTVAEASAFRRESIWTTFRKIREGVYESYLDGRVRKIVFASVKADRDRMLAESRNPPDTGKRRVGRPRKDAAQQPRAE